MKRLLAGLVLLCCLLLCTPWALAVSEDDAQTPETDELTEVPEEAADHLHRGRSR